MYEKERKVIIDFCLKMADDKLTVGTSGNISMRVSDHILITPSGVDYDALTPEQICVVEMDGNLISGTKKPSSELPLHRLVYEQTDAKAIVHTHPVYGTVLGLLEDETPFVHYMLSLHGGAVRVADYATFGSKELAENCAKAFKDRYAVLMRNHGAICYGDSLSTAYSRALYLEWVCQVWVIAKSIGEPSLLSQEEIDVVTGKLQTYGK